MSERESERVRIQSMREHNHGIRVSGRRRKGEHIARSVVENCDASWTVVRFGHTVFVPEKKRESGEKCGRKSEYRSPGKAAGGRVDVLDVRSKVKEKN